MRDPRFEWNNLAVFRHYAQERQAVQALLEALPALPALREGLRAWWRRFLESAPENPDETGLPEEAQRLSAELSGKVDARLAPLIAALARCVSRTTEDGILDRAAKHLLAEEGGRVTARGPLSAEAFRRGSRHTQDLSRDWMSFRDAFVAACMADAELRQAWVQALEAVPESIEAYVRTYARERGFVEALREEEVSFQKGQDPTRLWERRPDAVRFTEAISSRMSVLAALDLSALLRALERVPSARVMRELVGSLQIDEDRERILSGLREAAPVFDDQGWTGKRALMPWVEAIVRHGERLERAVAMAVRNKVATNPPADQVLGTLREKELPDWFREAFEVLIRRPDGQRVAILFAAHLAQDAQSRASSGTDEWPASLVALQALLIVLDAHGVRLQTVEETLARSKRGREMPFFLVGCSVELMHEPPSPPWSMYSEESREAAWQWYERMLAAKDEGLVQQVNPFGGVDWPFSISGAVLAGFEDVDSRWQAAWTRLFKDRQFARFRFIMNSLDPSLHLVRTGLGAIEMLLSVPPSEVLLARARQLWRTLRQALQYLVLGQAGTPLLSGPRELARAFAYLPPVFGAEWRSELASVVPLFQADEILALRAAYLMMQNGVDRRDLREAFALHGMDLRRIGEEAIAAESHEMSPEPVTTLAAMFQELMNEAPAP